MPSTTLLLRPPRREPRLLALRTRGLRAALVVLDPWEVRHLSELRLPREQAERAAKLYQLLCRALLRERPQVIVAPQGRSLARQVAGKAAAKLHVPLLLLSGRQEELPATSRGHRRQARRLEALLLGECLKTTLLPPSPLLERTAWLAQAGLLQLLKDHYDLHHTPPPKR